MMPPRSFWLLLLLTVGLVHGAGWNDPFAGEPTLTAYGPSDYKSVDANWSATVAPDGHLYVGNSAVLRFDGRSWVTIPIAGTYAIRALEADRDGRIWVGGVEELGYLENPSSTPRFVSLRDHLNQKTPIGAVWYIFHLGSRVVFVCDQRVLIWDGTAFEVREMPVPRRLFAFRYRSGVAISQPGVGLWFTDGRSFTPIDLGGLEKDEVGWGFENGKGVSFFGTSKFFLRYEAGRTSAIEGELSEFLRHGLATGATELPGGYFCIATFRSGAVVIDQEGKLCRVLDRSSGFPNPDFVSVRPLDANLLCVVGRRFVAFLDSTLDVTTFGARNGLALATSHLVAFGAADHGFLVTDDALFKLAPASTGARWEQLHEGQFLDAAPLGNGDFVFGGLRMLATWRGDGGVAVLRESNDVQSLAPLGNDRFVSAVGYTVRIGKSTAAGPEWEPATAKLTEPVSDLAVNGNEVWAATKRGGIHVLSTEGLTELRSFDAGRELPANFVFPHFVRVGSRLLVRSSLGCYFISATKVEPARGLAGFQIIASERWPGSRPDTWAIVAEPSQEQTSLLRLTESEGDVRAETCPLKEAGWLGRPMSLERDKQGALWIVGATGVLRIDPAGLTRRLRDRPKLFGATLRTDRETKDLSLGESWVLPATIQSLSFSFGEESEPLATPVLLQSRLVGADSSWQSSLGARQFTHLESGKYRLEVRLPGDAIATTLATFAVAPPWYRTFWFIGAAILVGAASIWLLVNYRLKQIAERNKELAALVETRTNELTKAVAAKSVFIAQLGHEIRNPLNGVVGLTGVLQALTLDSRAAEITSRLASCAHQLSSVVEDVLEFSLVEAGKVQVKRRPFKLLEPVRSAIYVCESANASLRIVLAADTIDVERPRTGDPDRIRQLLANYIENAGKYARGSEITVSVKQQAGERVVFCVSDKGPGIAASELSQVFDRFTRGEDARRKGVPGTGLGLAACRSYATAMSGSVWAESELGQGAKFFLALDLPFAAQQQTAPATASDHVLEGWSVFIVDDHDYNLFVLADILEKLGASVRSAASAEGVLRLFEEALPDLIFLDIDLGTESGMNVARQIRQSGSSYRDVPIVGMSAFELDDVREGCLRAGMNGFIAKPITTEKVATVVRQIESLGGQGGLIVADVRSSTPQSNLDLLSDGDPELRKRVIASARISLLETARALQEAAQREDLSEIRRHAHAITSAALTIDLAQVASLARETERCARQNSKEGCVGSIPPLLEALRATGIFN